ncbi:MAG: LacI family transcriptional regulator, gluconate utilization system Gnt-I transcriptional repressor [Acetobacteraceae bacterium]|jgi:LacI family gluconate utilization system Gnt-I transcriptional repressor|nr:LacI family transcriptional regulator, gluconate utilization system Gnt-I transcriptional repressor [Acetobacteraceae bacterium]
MRSSPTQTTEENAVFDPARDPAARPVLGRNTPIKITDVAAAAGVAPMTVSRVINTPDRVSPETTARVREAIDRLGYVPNLIAGGLSSRKSRMVAAIVPTIAHPMFASVVQSFSDSMRHAGYQVMLSICGYQDTNDEALFRALLGRRPDALLITGSGYTPAAWQMLIEAHIPVVEIWDVSNRPIDMMIGFDHAQVGAEVAAYFLAKGHDRFAVLSARDSRAMARARGFTETVTKAGGEVVLDQDMPPPSTIAAGREGLRTLLPSLDRRCAVFCSSDLLAFGVITEAGVQGVPVPDHLAVCGFGNFELSAMNEPPITTVSLEGEGTGRTAASFLLRRLAGEGPREGDRVQVPFRIVERATS